MKFFSKDTILSAYRELSKLTPDPTMQGATQATSSLRYLFALDHFTKIFGRPCDTQKKEDRDNYIKFVGEVVAINDIHYTANFFNAIKNDDDYKVGSNFFSVNTVKTSLENNTKEYDFPKRGNSPLFIIRSGELIEKTDYLPNLLSILSNPNLQSAFAIWLVRNCEIDHTNIYISVKECLSSVYSNNLVDILLPSKSDFSNNIDLSFSEHNPLLNLSDFPKPTSKAIKKESSLLDPEELVNKVRDSFIKFWNLIDEHGADKEMFVTCFEKAINPHLQQLCLGYDNIFQIVDFNQYEIIISTLVAKYPELSYLANGRSNDGTKYKVGSTHLHYRNYLQIIAFSDFRSNIDVQYKEANSLSVKTNISDYWLYLRAMRTKPFLLLAGISGTGKSRIVRQLARACWPVGSDEAKAHKPSNYEMIQVKPNWHDSSELLGYVSRIGDKPEFIAGDFLKFIAKAWENPDMPHFLCLDEMNLAPVEQYFAEYLSVVESRKLQDDGKTILTDPILDKEDEEWYFTLTAKLTSNDDVRNDFNEKGIRIPQNLIVVGTVNMDETTYSFSRKVLDRAMTIEMNEVNLDGGLYKEQTDMPYIAADNMLADAVEGYDVYPGNEDIGKKVIDYLGAINAVLADTPFRIAYRTRNEFLIYVINALLLAGLSGSDDEAKKNSIIADALDEVTSMKILSRIEGDKRKVHFLSKLKETIKTELDKIDGGDRSEEKSNSLAKLKTMTERLDSGYTSFWD